MFGLIKFLANAQAMTSGLPGTDCSFMPKQYQPLMPKSTSTGAETQATDALYPSRLRMNRAGTPPTIE